MLRWSLVFLIVALFAGALGAFRVQLIASQIGWILLLVFVVVAALALFSGRGRSG